MDNDLNYNARVTFEDDTGSLIYVNKLSNENLHKWQGWHCAAGVTAIHIYKNEIYSGECRNDLLGYLDQDWNLIDSYTVCKLDQCSGCTTDMLQEKYKP
jgi:hypothetical protein